MIKSLSTAPSWSVQLKVAQTSGSYNSHACGPGSGGPQAVRAAFPTCRGRGALPPVLLSALCLVLAICINKDMRMHMRIAHANAHAHAKSHMRMHMRMPNCTCECACDSHMRIANANGTCESHKELITKKGEGAGPDGLRASPARGSAAPATWRNAVP